LTPQKTGSLSGLGTETGRNAGNVTRMVSYGDSMTFFSDLSAGLKGKSFKGLDRINELPPVLGLKSARTDTPSEMNSPQLMTTRRVSSRRHLLTTKRKESAEFTGR